MTQSNPPQRLIAQTVVFAAMVFAMFVAMYGIGFHTVMKNYYLAGYCFVKGLDPYEVTLRNGVINQFMYSPFFAFLAGGVSQIPVRWQAIVVWQLLGLIVFSLGLGMWSRFSLRQPLAIYVALAACIIDLLTSMASYQVNALIIGLTLIALAAYRDRKYLAAGALLVLAANLKVYPVVFLIGLALARAPLRFWIGGLVAGLTVLFLPATVIGLTRDFSMHWEWLRLLSHNSTGIAILNLPAAFSRIDVAGIDLRPLGQVLLYFVGIVSAVVFLAHAVSSHRHAGEKILWVPWITLGVAAPILMSPRTEVFTFALLAPGYVLMAQWCGQHVADEKRRRAAIWFAALAGLAIAACRFIDPTWYFSEGRIELVRVLGALAIWGLAVTVVASALYRREGWRLGWTRQPATADNSSEA
jgi:hypothetical protein